MQHTETQACKDADELSTKNVSIREETTCVESEAKCAQTVVDPKADYETAIAVMVNGGTNPPFGSAEIAVENTESASSKSAREWRRRGVGMTSTATALDAKASSPELMGKVSCNL